MTKLICFAVLLCALVISAGAEVTPFVNDRPLALWSGQTVPVVSPNPNSGNYYLDYWLNTRLNSDTTGQVQNEQQVVGNALDPNNLIAVWRDFRLGYRRVGVGYSFDGGYSWHDELFPQVTYPWQSDPGLTWHTSGAIYAIVLSYNPSGEDGLFVSQTTNGGLTWGPFLPAVNAVPNSFEDKELIACDRTGSLYDGNLYIAWARFTNFQTVSRITSVRSTNGGSAWSTAVPVSDGTGVQWPVPAVGPEGQVYIGWVRYSPPGIMLDVSTNGGLTWGTDRLVQNTAFGSAYINPMLLIFSFPAMDVDITSGPHRGNVYIVYTDDWYGDADLFFTRSLNGGQTWSAPTRVNDDTPANGCDQFHPWLVCDENGTLHLIFYDRRNDPLQNLFMDLYYTYSTDAGITWAPNQRLTTVSSNPGLDSLINSGLIGEYNGLAVRNNVIHPVWTDTRNGHQDTYTAAWSPGLQLHPNAGTHIGGLLEAAPCPFNSEIQLTLRVPNAGQVELAVYDMAGRKIAVLAEGNFASGILRRTWQPEVSSGIYLIIARTAAGEENRKVLYLK